MTTTDDPVRETPKPPPPSRRRSRLLAVAAILVVALAAAAGWVLWDRTHDGQAMGIDDSDAPTLGDRALPPPQEVPAATGPPYVTRVSADRRYFLDQYGRPILVRGDSPWSMMTRMSPAQAEGWFADRRRNGYNAAIVSLVGATANGAPSDDGATFDGIRPFRGGDLLRWNETYFDRVSDILARARRNGITVMLYPIDGWTIDHAVKPESIGQCRDYGVKLAQRFGDLPNIVWMSGGDYFPKASTAARGDDVDHCIDAMMLGLRGAGDQHLFSMQLGYPKSLTTDNPYWAGRVDWNFVYTYLPTYRAVLQAYRHDPVLPAVLGESNYEGENNYPDSPPTTNQTLRRQVLWSLTSGATGDFSGSADWRLESGWEKRLDTAAVAQSARLHALFRQLDWWRLVPDTDDRLVVAGRGTPLTTDRELDVLQDDYVTAARTPDGRYAVVYVPAGQTITLDRGKLAAGTETEWVDPASGLARPAGDRTTLTPPGTNADGDRDWLLVVRP